MTEYGKVIAKTEHFYIDIVEEFRETEQQIINDSQFRSIFRKKDYDGNIAQLKRCKKRAQEMELRDVAVDADDAESQEVMERLRQALLAFVSLCDAQVRLQVFLKKKAMKEDAPFYLYRELFNKVGAQREKTNRALHALDLVYTDYSEIHSEEQWEKDQ